jgi:type IV secretory pathway VirB9-like protein
MLLSALINIASTITISANNPTTLVFNEPIQFVSAGKAGDFSIFINNNKKILVISPIKDLPKAEMIIVTDNSSYQFKIKLNNSNYTNYFQVANGSKNLSYSVLKKSENFELYEGKSSYMLKNISDKEININDEILKPKDTSYLPKGESIYINETRIL